MTELQRLRNAMFDEISRLKRGTSTTDEAMAICKLGNAIVGSYNTELKAIDTMVKVQEMGAEVPQIKIFEDGEEQCVEYAETGDTATIQK